MSPGVKSTQPAVTQRRRSCVSHGSECSRSAPKVGVRSRPARASRGSGRPASSFTAAVRPYRRSTRATAESALRTIRLVSSSPTSLAADLAADVAAAAAGERLGLVAEVAQDRVVPAAAALGPAHEVEEEAPLVLDHLGPRRLLAPAALDEAPAQRQVAGRVQEEAEGLLPVAPRAPDLLVVGLDRARRGEVDDGAHVGAVDAHAEGVGGHHDLERAVREGPLGARPRSRRSSPRGSRPRASPSRRAGRPPPPCSGGSARRRSPCPGPRPERRAPRRAARPPGGPARARRRRAAPAARGWGGRSRGASAACRRRGRAGRGSRRGRPGWRWRCRRGRAAGAARRGARRSPGSRAGSRGPTR